MNANELMIGDWVQYDVNAWRDDEYDRKCCVPDYQPFKIESGEELDKLILDDGKPKPIPLTPEILEKNGFISMNNGNNNIYYELGYNEYRNEVFWLRGSIIINYDGDDVYLCDVEYVHELQHALRLCGIEKEIVL